MDIVNETRKIDNARKNINTMRAAIVYNQTKELNHERELKKEYEANFEKERKTLSELEEGTHAYNTQLEKLDEASLILALTNETIAQYELNLINT